MFGNSTPSGKFKIQIQIQKQKLLVNCFCSLIITLCQFPMPTDQLLQGNSKWQITIACLQINPTAASKLAL